MRLGRAGLVAGWVLLSACQRPAAAPSVAYQVVDESQMGGQCSVCVAPAPKSVCSDDGQAAELRWDLPKLAASAPVRIVVDRGDGSRIEVATGPLTSHAPLPQSLRAGDRIVVLAAADGRELMFTRVQAALGCSLRLDQGGGTTSAGPG